MNKQKSTFKPLSLDQHFEAPDGFVGCFGWICGYSADSSFLENAVERFTRQTHAQRAYEGRISLALMLDRNNVQITPKEVPGVIHSPVHGEPPFRLLHAKVALLGFRHTSDARQWRLRLMVSTGNWTRQTLEDSLDLAWRIDICSDDLKPQDASVSQACADIGAAWEMLDWLRGKIDCRVLNARSPGSQDFESELTTVERWIARARKIGDGVAPRFFDNRKGSLLSQIPESLLKQNSRSARNYLAMGSGFYETPESTNRIPSVLKNIVDRLKDTGLLTQRPEIDVFVNPKACQAVANSLSSLNSEGWSAREPGQPEYLRGLRFLHAKFIFSANLRDNSDFCNSAWVYLGSGNLTGPGFTNRMDRQIGNLEAGVLFTPESLRWVPAKGVAPERVVTNLLPLQWETDFSQGPGLLAAGSEMPELETRYGAPPVAYVFWVVEEDIGWLRTSEEITESFDLLDAENGACRRDPTKGFPWLGTKPQQVQVSWCVGSGQDQRAWVPVIDEFGRIAATVLPRIGIEEAWGQLANFPMPPDEEELLEDPDTESGDGTTLGGSQSSQIARYPIRQMMQLVENIAAKQTSIPRVDWVTWCTRLEQCLIQAAGSPVVEEFLKLEINPLSPLLCTPFRPGFASSIETAEGLLYERVLQRIETAWGVAGLSKFGDAA